MDKLLAIGDKMKVISGPVEVTADLIVGLQSICTSCGTLFELDQTDFQNCTIGQITLQTVSFIIPCPNCSTSCSFSAIQQGD
jgi:hypothetical protein